MVGVRRTEDWEEEEIRTEKVTYGEAARAGGVDDDSRTGELHTSVRSSLITSRYAISALNISPKD